MRMKKCPDCLAPMPASRATFDRCDVCQRFRDWEPAFAAAEATLRLRAEEAEVCGYCGAEAPRTALDQDQSGLFYCRPMCGAAMASPDFRQ